MLFLLYALFFLIVFIFALFSMLKLWMSVAKFFIYYYSSDRKQERKKDKQTLLRKVALELQPGLMFFDKDLDEIEQKLAQDVKKNTILVFISWSCFFAVKFGLKFVTNT